MDENPKLSYLNKKALSLPLEPGVYLMKDTGGKIIYIGKAKALKSRVTSYFGSQERHLEKVRKMVSHVSDFDYIIVDSEFEALILECSLIKLHQPKYNILLKDDKGYSYIKITKPPYARITTAFQMEEDGSNYLGPYNSSYSLRQMVDEASKIFKLPTCKLVFPRDIGKSRPCLNYFIGQCSAPCARKITVDDYNDSVQDAIEFIKKGGKEASDDLTARMNAAAENLEFEKAARLRDRLNAIKHLKEKQKVIMSAVPAQDVVALAVVGEHACFEVFRFEAGRLVDREEFVTSAVVEGDARSEFLTQYYTMREVPPRVALDEPLEENEIMEQYLTEKRGKRVNVVVPKIGEQRGLVEMCKTNASERLAQRLQRTNKETAAIEELQKLLLLPNTPRYIEAYDISNTAGQENVGAMVVFSDGRPLKSAYKKFAIKGFEGQDDYASLAEVLDRRFSHYVEENSELDENNVQNKSEKRDVGFCTKPDIILIDGGKGQVNAVLPVIKKYGLDIPVFGMVKDNKHKTKAITANGEEIAIKTTRSVFTLVTSIQDEVHRFAINYHHKKKQKNTIGTTLTKIDGVGETTAKKLLKHFKTMTAISEASSEELQVVSGITKPMAVNIYVYFHGENQ